MGPTSFLAIIAFGVGAFIALSVAFSWIFARLYCRPKRRLPTKSPADHGLTFESITFHSHGVPLQGWFIPFEGNPVSHATIVVTHGWSHSASQMLPLAPLLHEAGFAVLLYNARGHGNSGDDGPITILKFAEDLMAAVDYLRGRADVDATCLGAVGHSLGGASAIVAASVEPNIRVVVSSSAFADPMTLTRDFMRALHIPRWPFQWLVSRFIERWLGTTMADIAPRNRIRRATVPILLIHGDSDQFIPPSNMETLYERAPQEHVQCRLIPGRGHSDVIRDSSFGPQVVEFLTEHL